MVILCVFDDGMHHSYVDPFRLCFLFHFFFKKKSSRLFSFFWYACANAAGGKLTQLLISLNKIVYSQTYSITLVSHSSKNFSRQHSFMGLNKLVRNEMYVINGVSCFSSISCPKKSTFVIPKISFMHNHRQFK